VRIKKKRFSIPKNGTEKYS